MRGESITGLVWRVKSGCASQYASNTFRWDRGISLVEIMVALFILGLTTSLVIGTLPQGQSRLHQDAEKLRSYLLATKREAVVSGNTMRVVIDSDGFHVEKWGQLMWQSVPENGQRTRISWHLPLGVEDLAQEYRSAIGGSQREDADKQVRLLYDATAVVPKIDLQLSAGTETVFLREDESGSIVVEEDQ